MRRLLLVSVAVAALAFGGVACKRGGPGPAGGPTPDLTPPPTHPPAFAGRGAAVATSAPGSVPLPAVTSTVAPTPEVRLRLSFAPGDVHVMTANSRMTFDSSLTPAGQTIPPMLMEMVVRYQIGEVAADGSALVEASFEKLDFRGGDMSTSLDLGGTGVRMRMRPDGGYADAHVERRGQELAAAGMQVDRLADMMVPFKYPATPLGVGGTFDRDVRMALGQGMPDAVAQTRYTLAELTTRQGIPVARLDAQASLPVPPPAPQPGVTFSAGRATIRGTDYASVANGWPVGGDQTIDMSFHLQGPDPRLSGTMSARAETTYTMR